MEEKLSIDELLNMLRNPAKVNGIILENTNETWSRIRKKDKFEELGLESDSLKEFLDDWISQNPYTNIK